MHSTNFLSLLASVGYLSLARADCVVSDDWEPTECSTGNGPQVDHNDLVNLVTCMQLNAYGSDDGSSVSIPGNGDIPDYGDGSKVSWYRNGVEVYMINTQQEDVCVDVGDAATLLVDGFEEDCKLILSTTGENWDVKIGIGACDAAYGCGSHDGDTMECKVY